MQNFLMVNSKEHFTKTYEESDRYLTNHQDVSSKIQKCLWAINELQGLIPETIEKFWSGHIFPYSECQYEIEASVNLCLLGFYKHSLISLRNALELGLISVYWDIHNKSELEIQNWLKSIEDTPFKKSVEKHILKDGNTAKFNKELNLMTKIDNIYKKLSNFSHTKGAKFSSRGLGLSNTNNFYEKSLLTWLEFLEYITQIIIAVHICKYPVGFQYTPIDEKFGLNSPMGGFLNPNQVENLKSVLPQNWTDVLQKISDRDDNALGMADWVNQKPNITSEELDKQIEKQDKEIIPHYVGGFKGWFKGQEDILNHMKDTPEQYGKHKKYMEKMKRWAKNKGLFNGG